MIIVIILILFFILFMIYGNQLAKKALESERIFIDFDDKIHSDIWQKDRIQRSLEDDLKVKNTVSNNYGGKIIGKNGDIYDVSLRMCTCQDFKKRRLPCKHMYYFAVKTGRASICMEDGTYIINRNTTCNINSPEKEIITSVKQSDKSIQFNDNMNYMLFDGEGIYASTKRKRKIHIEAFSEQEAIDELVASGYIKDTIIIHRVPFDLPSEAQLSAMRKHHNKIPKKACMNDISFLITKYMEDQREADKALMDFATDKKVKFSYYVGEKSLYSCIWNKFSLEEKFAFYLLCVEKDKKGKWNFEKFEYYKDLSSDYLNDDKFMNSFKRYSANGNDFYGFIKEKEIEYGYSASRNTNCYKIALSIIS